MGHLDQALKEQDSNEQDSNEDEFELLSDYEEEIELWKTYGGD